MEAHFRRIEDFYTKCCCLVAVIFLLFAGQSLEANTSSLPKSTMSRGGSTHLCSADAAKNCSDAQLCLYGTKAANGVRVWDKQKFVAGYYREARKRGLECRVGVAVNFNNLIVVAQEPSQVKVYNLCSASELLLTNEEVRLIQKNLARRGVYSGAFDGLPGRKTCIGLEAFLKVEAKTSSFGTREFELLKRAPSSSVRNIYRLATDLGTTTRQVVVQPRIVPAETKARQDRRRQCFANKKVNVSDQKLLKSLGFYKSKIDGVMGAGSKAAIVKAENLLGPWADDMDECLSAGERVILEVVDKQKSSGASCVFGKKSKSEVFHLYNQLRSDGLVKQSFGNFYPYQFAGFLNVIGNLENDLVVRGYYNYYWDSNRGRRDCWLDKVEITKLLELSGNKSKIAQSVASKANALQDEAEKPTLGKDDVSSRGSAETCDANPTLCSVVQLCQIATEMRNGKKAWKETSSSAPFIELAKANGVQCGVPSAPVIVEKILSCDDDPTLCSVVQLCSRATQIVDGEKSWAETEDRTKFVELAKSNGLQCGVPIEPQVANVLPTCDDDPKLCSVLQLCEKSTELSGNKKTWSSNAASAKYVELAKLSGLQCGVPREPVVVAAEPTCDDNPELCSVVQLCERAARVEDGVRKWTEEESFRGYIDAAKAAGLTCGVQPTPAIVAQVPNCKTDPTLCSVAELCTVSTSFDSEGNKVWNISSELSKHVSLAREQGVTCGVAQKQTLVTSVETCDTKPSLCSLADLCRKAISFETGSLGWTTDPKLTLHVEFAQNAGISCGVPSSATTNNVITQAAPKRDAAKEQSFGSYTNRKALVIGNSQYSQQTPLKNPRSDAETIARSLEKVGFEVELAFDLSRRDLGRAITSFSSRAKEADISLFYFAGHGIEIDSRNYLIPTDAIMDDPAALKYDVIDLEEAIDAAAGSSKLSLVMVDACRDNPFNNQVAGLNRSLSRGLKVIETDAVSKNQIVSFAAESGQVAEDGTGSNSPYAQIFSELVVQPNLEVGKMFRQLSDKVAEVTAGRQMPVSRNRLSGEDIFFLIER